MSSIYRIGRAIQVKISGMTAAVLHREINFHVWGIVRRGLRVSSCHLLIVGIRSTIESDLGVNWRPWNGISATLDAIIPCSP